MAYKTIYPDVNNRVDFKEAWECACRLDPSLRKLASDEETLQDALVTLARRVAELELEWS
jgi:hypothetical protein